MPVILEPDGYELWLDPGMKDVTAASELLKPLDAWQMLCFPVSTRINHVASDRGTRPDSGSVLHSVGLILKAGEFTSGF
jgi:putative SOS response-associated peptidase YedK